MYNTLILNLKLVALARALRLNLKLLSSKHNFNS